MSEEADLLRKLNATTEKLLEIKSLEFGLDPLGYITRKLRTGEGLPSVASYYQLIAPFPGTFALTFTNPEGYVWIGIHQTVDLSQQGVFEFIAMVDDGILPALYIPRLTSLEISWTVTLPFGNIIKNSTTITYVNHDAAAQWISVLSVGLYLRKDVWERDSRLMDLAAEKYVGLLEAKK